MVPHAGAVLGAAAAHQHDAVLLDVVALAGYVGGDEGAARELDARRLALARVGLLGAHDADAQAHALERGRARVGERGGHGVARALALADAAQDLVERGGAGGRGGKRGGGGGGEDG